MPQSAASLLVAWANQQDQWIRDVVSDVIATGRGPSEARLGEVASTLLRETALGDGEPPAQLQLAEPGVAGEQEQPLLLTSLGDVQAVNALAAGQTIPFNPGMTVLYGENAAGKSGYVRILKGAAAARGAEPILPNIRGDAASAAPSATIAFKLGDTPSSLSWRDGVAGPGPLRRISVFDARAAVLHLDDNLTYTYTPSDLKFFPLVHDVLDRMKQLLEDKRQEKLPTENNFLPHFEREDGVYAKLESLGRNTDLAELGALADIPAADEEQIDDLRRQVEALAGGSQDRITVVSGERDLFREVKAAAATMQTFDVAAYNARIEALSLARMKHRQATELAFAGSDIPSVLGEEWAAFVRAGEDYLRTLGEPGYPTAGDKCAYCRQPLDAAALALVKKYRDFCNDTLAQEVERQAAELRGVVTSPLAIDLARLDEGLRKLVAALPSGQEPSSVLRDSLGLVETSRGFQDDLRALRRHENTGLPTLAGSAAGLAEAAVVKLDQTISDLGTEATERKAHHARESAKLRHIEARRKLRALLAPVRRYVEADKWAEDVRVVLGGFPGLKRSLTETSKVASEQLLNTDFERLFQHECAELRAPAVNLDFPGRRGEAARRKSLVPDHKLSETLSEGEQKVIALADFLAEAALKPTPAPIIFDDPVNSLDSRRLQYVASRLAALAETRQVIVFTHSVWFTAGLLERFEERPSLCTYIEVTEAPPARGLIARGIHPRLDTLNSTKTKINRQIQEARAARNAGGEGLAKASALVESTYGYLRNMTELVVEQELLRGIMKRFTAHVAMTQLPNIRCDRLADAVAAIYPVYERCCRATEAHSQPMDTLGVRPSLEDLESDWQTVQNARSAYTQA